MEEKTEYNIFSYILDIFTTDMSTFTKFSNLTQFSTVR